MRNIQVTVAIHNVYIQCLSNGQHIAQVLSSAQPFCLNFIVFCSKIYIVSQKFGEFCLFQKRCEIAGDLHNGQQFGLRHEYIVVMFSMFTWEI